MCTDLYKAYLKCQRPTDSCLDVLELYMKCLGVRPSKEVHAASVRRHWFEVRGGRVD